MHLISSLSRSQLCKNLHERDHNSANYNCKTSPSEAKLAANFSATSTLTPVDSYNMLEAFLFLLYLFATDVLLGFW